MTEAEWDACTDPSPMVDHLGDRLTERKLRLCACARARRQAARLDDRSRAAIETAERFADGLATPEELRFAFRGAEEAWEAIPEYTGSRRAMRRSTRGRLSDKDAARVALACANPHLARGHIRYAPVGKTLVLLSSILRDLFGPLPFRPLVAHPDWLACNGGAVRGLAESIYADGTVNHLPVLADALEEAGCAEASLLDHLRGGGPHVRGCWALDLLTGRS